MAVLDIPEISRYTPDSFGILATAVLSACLYLIRSCRHIPQAYDWIGHVFNELQEISGRLYTLVHIQVDGVTQKKIVAILAFVLKVIGRSESLINEQSFHCYLRVMFLGRDEKTKELVEDLNKLFGSDPRFSLAVTYPMDRRADEGRDVLEKYLERQDKVYEETKEKELTAKVDERIRQTLCNTSAAEDVIETYHKNKRSLLEGTGSWLQHERLFDSWLNRRATILWIFGGPGSGKSYLSTWLIKRLCEDPSEEGPKHISVAYFFVKENNEVLRDANNILKALAWQLIKKDPRFRQHVARVTEQRHKTSTADDTWENLFLAYYDSGEFDSDFALILIDGLDEADHQTRRKILGFMKGLVTKSQSSEWPRIQFAIVGRGSLRDDMDITRQERIYPIEISKHKNKKDIESYIRKRLGDVAVLKEIERKQGLKSFRKYRRKFRNMILEGADGVFLWAKLLIDSILRKDLRQIEKILKDPPENLDDMICSVFDRIANDEELDHNLLRKMLLFCGYSLRPLTFGELDLFVSLPSPPANYLLWNQTRGKLSSIFDLKYPSNFDPDEEDNVDAETDEHNNELVECCQDDVKVVDVDFSDDYSRSFDSDDSGTESTDDDDENDDGLQSRTSEPERKTQGNTTRYLSDGQRKTEITFCHTRIKDYLVREGDPMKRRKPACVVIPDLENAHLELTITCLSVLRLELSLEEDRRYLVDYSRQYLASHLERIDMRKISDSDFSHITEGLHWLFGTEKGAECFIKANQEYDERHSSRDEFLGAWICSERNLRTVQAWFRDVKYRSSSNWSWDTASRLWMDNAAESFETLLVPLMKVASKLWLTKSGYDSDDYRDKGEFYTWMLHGWLSLVSGF